MSPNIHEIDKSRNIFNELAPTEDMPSEPKYWDTNDVTKYSWAKANQANPAVKSFNF